MRHGGTRNATLTRRIVPIGRLFDCRRGDGSRRDLARIIEERHVRAAGREDMRGRFGHELPTLRELEGGFKANASSFFVLVNAPCRVKQFFGTK